MSEVAEAYTLKYNASKTCAEFIRCNDKYQVIGGPIGSGKSVASIIKIFKLAQEMPLRKVMRKGKEVQLRTSRWAIIRNTKEQLKDTTLKTWFEWFPDDVMGKWKGDGMTYTLKVNDIEAEIMFRALDKPDDVRKLLSLELTGAYCNEWRELPQGIFGPLMKRCGRYPRRQDVPEYWYGIFCDTNYPEEDTYHHKVMEKLPQDENDLKSVVEATIFEQPPGDSPEAENLEFLQAGYYSPTGMLKEEFENLVQCQYAKSISGKAVYDKQFKKAKHIVANPIYQDLPVIIGMDFGLSPSAVFMQVQRDGRLFILRETPAFGMGTKQILVKYIKPMLINEFPDCPVVIIGDPSGINRSQYDSDTDCFKAIKEAGYKTKPAITNDLTVRIETFFKALTQYPDGEPLVQIHPKCKMLVQAFNGKYRYRKVKNSAGDLRDYPDKNDWSHTMEAAQYGCLFALSGKYREEDYTQPLSGIEFGNGFETHKNIYV